MPKTITIKHDRATRMLFAFDGARRTRLGSTHLAALGAVLMLRGYRPDYSSRGAWVRS